MSTVRHPVGPEGPRVYWIRRAIVVAVAAGVIALLWAFLTQRGGEEPPTAPPADPQTSATPSTEPVAGTGCTEASLSVVLTASAQAYAASETPSFTLTATNTGETACTLTVGDPSRQLAITSGTDRIWSSTDCPGSAPAEAPLLLLGKGDTTDVTIVWDRSRSADGCPAGLATPRSGTYKAVASLLGAKSESVAFTLD